MKEIIVGSKTDHELSQMDRLEQRIIDLAYQQTIFLVNDNKQIFALLEKAEAENKAMREALEMIKAWTDPFPRKWAKDALSAIKGDTDE